MMGEDEVIISLINDIKEMAVKQRFANAFGISSELTKFSILVDNEDTILIGEILEGIFSQIGPIFDNYKLNDEEINLFVSGLIADLNSLIVNYQDKNYNKLYLDLKNLRSKSTKLQIKQMRVGVLKDNINKIPPFNKIMNQIME